MKLAPPSTDVRYRAVVEYRFNGPQRQAGSLRQSTYMARQDLARIRAGLAGHRCRAFLERVTTTVEVLRADHEERDAGGRPA